MNIKKIIVPDNLTDIAYQAIKDEILNLNIKPGTKITQDDLSNNLGISKTPIREALQRLEAEGLIQIFPRSGTYVSTYGVEDVVEIYNLREMLEGLACRLAVETLDSNDYKELEVLIKDAHQAALERDIVGFSHFDSKFHLELVKRSRSNRLLKIYSNIYDLIQIIRLQNLHLPRNSEQLYNEHLEIFQTLKSGQADKAEAAVRSHLRRVKDSVISIIKEKEEFGETTP